MTNLKKVFSVSEFVQYLRTVLEQQVGAVAIQGEVTGFRISNDRFVWFDVKDEGSNINCFMLKQELSVPLEDGMEVQVLATPSLFVKSGKFHLRVHAIELKGEGALQKAFELLRKKLAAEGLFSEERKREIPRFPETIGLITSTDAAAYTDVLRILKNRWNGLLIKHYPVKVQGLGAPKTIVEALSYFNTQENVDVIILTRGGGSLEDLQAFNSEEVARAIAGSAIPVVCGVGHERDESLAEYVADVRASTPSNAAERVVPDKQDVLYRITSLVDTVVTSTEDELERRRTSIGSLILRLQSRIEERVKNGLRIISETVLRGMRNLDAAVVTYKERIESLERVIKSYNPENVLKRGYAVVRTKQGKLLRSVKDVTVGDTLVTRVTDGEVESAVTK